MKYILSIIVVIAAVLQAPAARAQLMVEQGKIFENVQTGQTLAGKLTLFNTGELPLKVKVSWEDFQYLEPFSGKKKFVAAGTLDRSILEWTRFSPKEFSLGPFSRQVVNYTIKVPEDARGGYYGVMFFEQLPEGAVDFTGVRVVTRVGTLFFLETVSKSKKAAVEKLRVEDKTLRGQLVNQGDVILVSKGIYYFLDKDGVPAMRGELESVYLPPGKTAAFEVALDNPALTGKKYTMVLTMDCGEGDSVVRELDLIRDGSGWQVERVRE